jgi:hypothetical protein
MRPRLRPNDQLGYTVENIGAAMDQCVRRLGAGPLDFRLSPALIGLVPIGAGQRLAQARSGLPGEKTGVDAWPTGSNSERFV